MIFDIWYMIWYIDGRKFDPNWASAAILSDRGWNLAFGRRELSTFQDTEVRFREVALFGTCHPQLLRSVFVCADVDAFCLSCPKFRNIGKTIKNNSAHFCRSNRWRCWHTAEQDFYIAVMPHSQSWIQWLGQGQSWISSREAQKQYWKKLRWMNHRDLIDFMAFWCDFNDCNGILIGFNDHEGILVIESGSYSLSTHFHKNVPQYSCMLIWLAPRTYFERGDRPTFFDHSFHRTSNRIETTCIIGHFTHFVGCWKFTQHYKGELTVRLVKDMSSITRTHSLLPKILGSAEPAVTTVALDDGSGSEVSECLRNQAHSDHSDSSI